MAIYKKLSILKGGGIVSAKQQARQVSNTVNLFIGLGGTGIDCIKTIKTAVKERIQPDDPNAAVPEYEHIQFLGVDTDRHSLKNLPDTEIFDISYPLLVIPGILHGQPELKWFNYKELDIPNLDGYGTGGCRQIGRCMMMLKSDSFMDEVETRIRTAKSGLVNPNVNIHIFSGLCGGTGSGIFLDVCYMVKEVAALNGGATVFGYFFLPEIDLERIPYNRAIRHVLVNKGYAAMQELDYCMRIAENGGSFTQPYKGGKQIKWEEPPVTMCHLVSATDTNNNVIPNAYNHAINVTSEYVLNFLIQPGIDFFQKALGSIPLVEYFQKIGANLNYCSLGASSVYVPMKEINTYLVSKLFGKFKGILGNQPTDQGVLEFVKKSGLSDYNMLFWELFKDAQEPYISFNGTWREVRDYGDKVLVVHYVNQTANKIETIEKNARGMRTETNSNSLIGRMREVMVSYITSIQYGPIYACGMLEAANSYNLLNFIDGLIENNTNRRNQEKFQNRYDEYEYARYNFDRRPNRKTFEEYEWRIACLEKQKLMLVLVEQMDTVLKKLKKQVIQITKEYYLVLQRVVRNLLDTFEENSDTFDTGKGIMKTNDFAKPLMTIAELRPKLDAAIGRINIEEVMGQFMNALLAQEDQWKQEDENKIAKLVNDFFVNIVFSDFASKSITSFLQDKYNTNNDEIIANRLYGQYMQPLVYEAELMLRSHIWPEPNKIACILVPGSAKPIVDAAQELRDRLFMPHIVGESALTDRFSLIIGMVGFPIASYVGIRKWEYEKLEMEYNTAGLHIYEEWRELPPLIPESCIDYNLISSGLKEQLEARKELYETAIASGLLEGDTVCTLDEISKQKLETSMLQAEKAMEAVKTDNSVTIQILEKTQAELVQVLADAKTVPAGYILPHRSVVDEETANRVRKDFFLSSPAIQEMIKADLSFVNKVKTVQDQLEKIVEKRKNGW